MRGKTSLAGAAALLFLLAGAGYEPGGPTSIPPREQAPIEIYYHERPPYTVTAANGTVCGVLADPAAHFLRAADIPFTWVLMPAKRQLQAVRGNDRPACALGWFKRPDRETYGRYTRLPLYTDRPMALLGRAGDARLKRLATLNELFSDHDLVLLIKDGYSYGAQLDRAIAALTPRTDRSTAENLNMATMVAKGRADYMLISQDEAPALLDALDRDTASRLAVYDNVRDMPMGSARYLICSHKVGLETMRRLDAVMARERRAEAGAQHVP
ncbi:MAG: hypothetical protein H0S85_02710 [Desulfovibrionaceae bacterium]|jgi:hypothetical protein|nr:hypothetical protein [Desulfovibrionaceae bacterium]